jgi:hypothetical protein
MPSNPHSLHLRSDWEGERVPKIVLNAELSKKLPKPVENAEDRRKIHLVLIDNSSWQKMGPRQFVLLFKTRQDASTFLTTIEFCFKDEVKKDKAEVRKDKAEFKKKVSEGEEYEQLTQLWPESPIMFDAPSETDSSIDSPLPTSKNDGEQVQLAGNEEEDSSLDSLDVFEEQLRLIDDDEDDSSIDSLDVESPLPTSKKDGEQVQLAGDEEEDSSLDSVGILEKPEAKYEDMTLEDLIVECRKRNIKADKRFAKQTLINKLVRLSKAEEVLRLSKEDE